MNTFLGESLVKQMGLGGTALAGGVVLCFGGLTSGQGSVLGFLCAVVPPELQVGIHTGGAAQCPQQSPVWHS